MKISVLIGTRNRPALLSRCLESVAAQNYPFLEIVILDDASSPSIREEEVRRAAGALPVRCIRSEKQLGPIRARNRLLEAANGEIFFIIDDDAFFQSAEAMQHIVDTFASDDNIGIVATKILDSRSGTVRPLTPHSRRHIRRNPSILNIAHRVSYFLGGAHAIHRRVIQTCGDYDGSLVFGLEEIELSYRVLEKGFRIQYQPAVVVHHRPAAPAPDANEESRRRIYYLTRNRILFAYKYLPLKYLLFYVPNWLAWQGYSALASGSLHVFFRGVADAIKTVKQLERRPIGPGTIAYLKANHGRLWR